MTISELIEHLSRASAYPEPVDSVQVHQTHISVVFLAGESAYKIKKPVDLGFVNYSTLARRRHFCEAEVRLNRRLAPGVYLGVVPVTRDGEAVRIEGKGETIEWAVKMKRLADCATLRARVEDGDLGAQALGELASRLARFHADAASGEKVAAGASFAAVARNARENFDQARSQIGITVSEVTIERLKARTDLSLVQLRPLIERRAARGIPRDTHGDLRLDHVYWFPEHEPPGDWVVVDCIEFDARFRDADPIADIAFLAMELTLDGRGDLARAFCDSYLQAAGDEEGRALLPFYMAYRAAVRAKVEGMKLQEPEISAAGRAAALARARALWLFALGQLEDPSGRPCLLLVGGLPGAGKSTLARELASAAGFVVIRSDVVRKELAGRSDESSRPAEFGAEIYTSAWNDRTYAECLRRAEQLVFEGRRVLIDASFREESRRRAFFDAARRWGIAASMIHCHAEPNVVAGRLARRPCDASDAVWATYLEAARKWEEPDPKTRALIRTIDTGSELARSRAAALDVLREFNLLTADG
jgi:uncharacterized protein